MKKLSLILATLSIFIFSSIPTYAAGTIKYSGDVVSFEYPEDFDGTIMRSDTNDGDHYFFKSTLYDFEAGISEISFDYYERVFGVGKDGYVDFLINDIGDEYMRSEILDNDKYPEARQIFRSNGYVQYRKIIGESPNSFLLVYVKMPNDNDCELVNLFKGIYDSMEANADWIKYGSEAPENEKYGIVIFDSNS